MPTEVEVGACLEGALLRAARVVTDVEVDVSESGGAADEHHQNRQPWGFVLHGCSCLLSLRLHPGWSGREEKSSKNAHSERPKHSKLNLASPRRKAHFSGDLAEGT